MTKYVIQDSTLTDIADAIREKTGDSSAMTPAQMVTAIGAISGGGSGGLSLLGSGTFTVATVTSQITIPVSVNGTIKCAYVEKDVEVPSVGQMLKWRALKVDPNATDIYNWMNQLAESYYVASNGAAYGYASRSATPGGLIASITDSEILLIQYSNNYRIQNGSYTWKVWGEAAT